jgi:hypothetical protein
MAGGGRSGFRIQELASDWINRQHSLRMAMIAVEFRGASGAVA